MLRYPFPLTLSEPRSGDARRRAALRPGGASPRLARHERGRSRLAAALVLLLVPSLARADDPAPTDDDAVDEPRPPARRWHGSVSIGGSLLVSGDGGDASRFD